MPVYGALSISTLGMKSQAHALNTIGINIANMTTGGYKRTETRFSGLVSKSVFEQSDIGGVKPQDSQFIDQQGILVSGSRNLDLAINGQGFFIVTTALSGGDLLYTRDGSFEMKTENPTPSATTGGPTSYEGYLVDKNGYYVQGWTSDPATGQFTNTTLSPLRIDAAAFANSGIATTVATLNLNVPAGDAVPLKQVDKVTFGGAVVAGDTYSVGITGGTPVTLTVTTETTLNEVRDALIGNINGDATLAATLTASADGDGILLLTADAIGGTFTPAVSVINGGGAPTAVSQNLQAAQSANTHITNIDLYDSTGTRQTVALNFAKTATNQWQMTNTTSRTPVAQVDTITLTGTPEAGDTYTVTVDGVSVVHTVTTETTLDQIRDNLVTAINGDAVAGAKVTAAASTAGVLTLTAANAGTAYTATSSATHGGTSVAQVDTVTIAVGGADALDEFTVTINGFPNNIILAGGETLAATRTAMINAINTNGLVNGAVTAAPGVAPGDITITSDAAGTAFTTAVTKPVDTNSDNAIAFANTTANYTAVADNTSTLVNTTANVTNSVTSAPPLTLAFDGNGVLTSTSPLSLSLTFAGGGSASVALDISGITQYDGPFMNMSYTKNGNSGGTIRNFSFNSLGELIATFQDSTFRPIYKLPLATFPNPNAMEMKNGAVFAQTQGSGTATVAAVETNGMASFVPNTLEKSNVDIADEFSRMIMTQSAYNSSATVFKTIDEMLVAAGDLKR